MNHIFFVYGTLKRGYGNNSLLRRSFFLQEAVLPDHKIFSLGGFPGIFPEKGFSVKGELWVVPTEDIESLDALEGHPYMYVRTLVRVEDYENPVYTYIWNRPGHDKFPIIKSGEWRHAW